MSDLRDQGIKKKYVIKKVDGSQVDEYADYFVLRLDEHQKDEQHRKACRIAILVYANKIKEHLPKLAEELIQKYG